MDRRVVSGSIMVGTDKDVAYLKGMDVVEAAKFATGVSSIKCTRCR